MSLLGEGGVLSARKPTDPLGLGYAASMLPNVGIASAGFVSANRAVLARGVGAGVFSSVRLRCTSGATGNVCIAIYANVGVGAAAAPGARLATTGSVACPAASAALALDATVVATHGSIWFAFTADTTTPTFVVVSPFATADAIYAGQQAYKDTVGLPLPSTITGVTSGFTRMPLLVGV